MEVARRSVFARPLIWRRAATEETDMLDIYSQTRETVSLFPFIQTDTALQDLGRPACASVSECPLASPINFRYPVKEQLRRLATF